MDLGQRKGREEWREEWCEGWRDKPRNWQANSGRTVPFPLSHRPIQTESSYHSLQFEHNLFHALYML